MIVYGMMLMYVVNDCGDKGLHVACQAKLFFPK
jgi:hypothetical protein